MLQFIAAGPFSFVREGDPPRWCLREGDAGKRALPLRDAPFAIGRSSDCQLVLPDSEALCRTTSRWHCHLLQREGSWVVCDGSLKPVPETGQSKPSISGTFLNGNRLWRPEPLKPGDVLAVGPWEMRLEDAQRQSVDIDRVLRRIGEAAPLTLAEADSASRVGFESLAELFTKLYSIKDNEECLAVILQFALEKIPAAQVAAVLTFAPDGSPTARLAWQKGSGRLYDFRFSSGLLQSLPADRAFLLKSRIQDATKSQLEEHISSGLLAPLRGREDRLGVLYMDNRNHGSSFQDADLYLANALAGVAALQLALERQAYMARVEQNMRQYFGPEVVRLIVDSSRQGKPVSLGVKECEATVFFVDMEGFSAFCRGRSPLEVSELLNPYFEIAAQAIQGQGGHVDKFLGDGVMGVFGAAPLDDPRLTRTANHAVAAVAAGQHMIERWRQWSSMRWGTPIRLRIGINTGRLVLGNIGFPGRMEYSALGDTVNLASRLESAARPDSILVSESTYRMLGGACPCVYEGEAEVQGFGPVKTWRVI
ncbi:MAG: FHA domain-containing protein [Elusimicrobia bacterium]|nr:FHA domain-containing protein [Elusimicrobiota bacterium]